MPKEFGPKPEAFTHGGEWPRLLYMHGIADDDLVIVYNEAQKTKALKEGWSLTAAEAKAKTEKAKA